MIDDSLFSVQSSRMEGGRSVMLKVSLSFQMTQVVGVERADQKVGDLTVSDAVIKRMKAAICARVFSRLVDHLTSYFKSLVVGDPYPYLQTSDVCKWLSELLFRVRGGPEGRSGNLVRLLTLDGLTCDTVVHNCGQLQRIVRYCTNAPYLELDHEVAEIVECRIRVYEFSHFDTDGVRVFYETKNP